MSCFEGLGVMPELIVALEHLGWNLPTAVQDEAIPLILGGGDVMIAAETGGGKTGAYFIPLLQLLCEQRAAKAGVKLDAGAKRVPQVNLPFAIVLTSTRELAAQVLSLSDDLTPFLGVSVKTVVVSGGVGMEQMVKQCQQGVDVVIGTPATVATLLKARVLDVRDVKYLVCDEADFLIDSQSNKQDITRLYSAIVGKCQVVICSATLHVPSISELAERICQNPTWVDLKGKDSVPESVTHCAVLVDPNRNEAWKPLVGKLAIDGIYNGDTQRVQGNLDMQSLAVKHLKLIVLREVIGMFQMTQAIIFCRTQLDCDNVETYLSSCEEFKSSSVCAVLHGGRREQRTANLERFRNESARFLIATDLGARGLDIPEVPFVINFSLPDTPATYIHRVGRVGRAGLRGLAVSLVNTVPERVWYHTCKNDRDCHNTALTTERGCTVWYDEPEYLRAIETRLGDKVQKAQAEHLNEFVARIARTMTEVLSGPALRSKQHVESLQPALVELSLLETEAQRQFLNFQRTWVQKDKAPKKP